MKTREGYSAVKDILNQSPEGRQMFKSLQKQTVENLMSSVVKEGQIDFVKARDILSDPHMRDIVKEVMGESGVKFFRELEFYGKNMAENLQRFKAAEPSIFKKFFDKITSHSSRTVFYALTPYTMGKSLYGIAGIYALKAGRKKYLINFIMNKRVQELIKKMGQRNVSPNRMGDLIKSFSRVANEVATD